MVEGQETMDPAPEQPGVAMVPEATQPEAGAALGALAFPLGVAYTPPGKRLLSWLLESVLMSVTLGIGWLIWALSTVKTGQTPAKKLLGIRVIDLGTGAPATLGKMFWVRGLLGGLVASIAFPVTLGILAFMPFWDKRNQTLYEKVSSTVVVDDPQGLMVR